MSCPACGCHDLQTCSCTAEDVERAEWGDAVDVNALAKAERERDEARAEVERLQAERASAIESVRLANEAMEAAQHEAIRLQAERDTAVANMQEAAKAFDALSDGYLDRAHKAEGERDRLVAALRVMHRALTLQDFLEALNTHEVQAVLPLLAESAEPEDGTDG